MIVDLRVVRIDAQAQDGRRQAADSRQNGIRIHHAIALCGNQRDARIDQLLLGIEDVERGSLSKPRLLPDAVQRGFGRLDLGLR